jgi:putative hydrolases of HD superfamily
VSGIEREIQFIVEADKLKNGVRKTRNISNDRYENDAEHSWHTCLMAVALQARSNAPVDISRVLQMLIVHDLGEISGGDIIVYLKTSAHTAAELEAARALLSLLGEGTGGRLHALMQEFEARQTDDARYANAIDRAEPLLQNIHNNGETWRARGITYEQILTVNEQKISEGSEDLWRFLRARVDAMKVSRVIG